MGTLAHLQFARKILATDGGEEIARADYGRIVAAYNQLADSWHAEDRAVARQLYRHCRLLIDNHDERGNWTGAVANENGWTA